MLPTFVIGLREGLEAALIVGIVAAFLRTNGRRGDLRRMWFGVLAAVALCICVGIGLQQLSNGLPQREQEMLECVIAVVAVGMVTFMILWMRTHARTMKSSLEGAAGSALAKGSAWAMVGMAFLAVLREGFETSVFLLAALQNSSSGVTPLIGALLGLGVSLVLGWALYRGALRFNMGRFFTITSVFLVLVAAGLVMKAFRAAYEAGWLAIGQQQVLDLSGAISRGSVGEAVLGGVFGLQAQPVLIEVLGYLAYAVPMLIVVLAPARLVADQVVRRRLLAAAAGATAVAGLAGLAFASAPRHGGDAGPATVQSLSASEATVAFDGQTHTLPAEEHVSVAGIDCVRYRSSTSTPVTDSASPATLTGEQIKTMRGRYPVGITELDAHTAFPAAYVDTTTITVDIDPRSHEVLAYQQTTDRVATVTLATGSSVQAGTVSSTGTSGDAKATTDAAERAAAYAEDAGSYEIWRKVVPLVTLSLALVLSAFWLAATRRERRTAPDDIVPASADHSLASTTS